MLTLTPSPPTKKDKPSPFERAARRIQGKPAVAPVQGVQAEPGVWPDPVDWIEHNFYLYDTGQLMLLHESQKQPLYEALRKYESGDLAGKYVYSTVCWSWPKKS